MATWHETEKPVKYGNDKFTVAFDGDKYREGWERMFGEKSGGDPQVREDHEAEPTWPCKACGKPMTKAEGGTVFTVCDSCWGDVLSIG